MIVELSRLWDSIFYSSSFFSIRFRSARYFNVEAAGSGSIALRYDTKENCIYLKLPCLPAPEKGEEEEKVAAAAAAQIPLNSSSHIIPKGGGKHSAPPTPINWSKLKCLTPHCRLQMDARTHLYKLDNNFGYGFGSRFHGKIRAYDVSVEGERERERFSSSTNY